MRIQQYGLLLTFFYFVESRRTILDAKFLQPFRVFKQLSFGFLTSSATNQQNSRQLKSLNKLQPYQDGPFPCPLNNTRSPKRPNTVHELRPGDIDIVGAIGDSLTAGFGPLALSIPQVFLESRGLSFSIGGEKTWRTALTVPNILKEFNPNLFGYSLRASTTLDKASQFNAAEGGAFSEEMPYMAKVLVQRIKKDPRVDLKNDWKLITVLIGANNFCTDICYRNSEELLNEHRNDIISALRTFRDNLPRTIVNLIPPPHMRILAEFTNKPQICYLTHSVECGCIVGLAHAQRQKQLYDVMYRWQEMDEQIANLPEFDLDDFTVVYQPFVLNYTFPTTNKGYTDWSYMSSDCFHFSQKGNARVANSLWNNMLEPVGKKSKDGMDIMKQFNCPTEENPFIYTRRNSQ